MVIIADGCCCCWRCGCGCGGGSSSSDVVEVFWVVAKSVPERRGGKYDEGDWGHARNITMW